MKRLFLALVVLFGSMTTKAQYVKLAAGDTITENFDEMAKTATAQLPQGWKVGKRNDFSRIVGTFSSAGASTEFSGGSSIVSNASGGIYNFGAGDTDTTTDRAIGGLATGTAAKSVTLFVDLYNNGNDTISSYTISYDVEKYRNGLNPNGFSVKLYYSTDGIRWNQPGPIFTSSFPADTNNNGDTSVPISKQSVVSKLLTLYNFPPDYYMVAPKMHFYLAWNYSVTSDDVTATTTYAQALGVDNVVITAKAKVSPPVLTAGTLNGFGNVCVGSTSAPNSFTLTGKSLDGTLPVIVGPLEGYSFSTSENGSYTNTLSYSGSSLDTTVYVKFSPTSVKYYNDNIPVSGGNAAAINIAVSGAGINTGPTVSRGNATNITTTGALITDTITNVGCSAITGYGIAYSTTDGFTNGTGTTAAASNLSNGSFSSDITGLSAGTIYYYRAYATNSGGTSYGAQQSFTTDTLPVVPPPPPLEVIASSATNTTTTSFTANWHPAGGDTISYYLDVSTAGDFIDDQTTTTIAKWIFPDLSADAIVDTANSINTNKIITASGTKEPAFDFNGASSKAARTTGWDEGSGISYWQIELNTTGQQNLLLSSKQKSSSTGPKDFKIQYKIGSTGGVWTDIASPSVTVGDNFTTGAIINRPLPDACSNQPSLFIRWVMASNTSVGGATVSSAGSSFIDDIIITGNQNTYIAGYRGLPVNDTSQLVAGLSPNTTYYYRVRATHGNTVSENSNSISVTTTEEEKPLQPTTLLSFSGKEQENKNLLQWLTATENNNQGFDVQRSSDSIHFQSISFIPSAAPDGNSTEIIDYMFSDYDIIAGDSQYYRLEVINLDQTTGGFSDTILIRKEKKEEPISIDGLYPNPASGNINLKISVSSPDKFMCSIVDSRGHILKQFPLTSEPGSNVFKIDITGISPGAYHLKCVSRTGTVTTRKFIVR